MKQTEEHVSLERAVELLTAGLAPLADIEERPLLQAAGMVLARDIRAPLDNPPFDRSPLDGYALRAEDISGARPQTPVRLRVIGCEYAGGFFAGEVGPGEALRIMTGARMPAGSDCVVRQEDTDQGMELVEIHHPVSKHQNYCFQGEDIRRGAPLIPAGKRLSSVHLGILASMGVAQVPVRSRTRVAVLCTGDEISPLGQPLGPGKIYNSNLYLLLARLAELGAETPIYQSCPDEPRRMAELVRAAAAACDLVVTTGGVSVGAKDIMHEVVALLGAPLLFRGLDMKPGSPALAARLGEKLLLCLSGNPFAAITTFELLARPALAVLGGDEGLLYRAKQAALACDFPKKSPGRRLIRARHEDGRAYLNNQNHSSGALYSMEGCNALIDIPAGNPGLRAGETVRLLLL